MSSRPFQILAACALALSTGCASSYRQLDRPLALYESGDLEGAAALLESEQYDDDRDGETHGVLWLLETGKVLHDIGRFEDSETAFERADQRIRTQDLEPSVSISEEVTSLLTTQQARTFRARGWQKILLESYRSLNLLALGDLDEALVMARRSYARQADAVFEHSKEIEKRSDTEEAEDAKEEDLIGQGEVQDLLGPIHSRISPAYADFANPFTSYLAALLQWADDDRTRAVVDMRKTHGMVPDNAFVEALLLELEGSHDIDTPAGRVYVIFENGMAPERIEVGIGIVTRNGYSSIRLPTLSYHDTQVTALELQGDGGALNMQTAPLADIDAMVSVDFADELPGIIIRTALSIVTKEVATKQIRNENQDLGFLIGTVWKALTEGADLRTWRSVGARFDVAHFDRPADGVVTLNLLDNNGGRHLPMEIELPRTTLTFLLCRSVNLASLRCHIVPAGQALPELPLPELLLPELPPPATPEADPAAIDENTETPAEEPESANTPSESSSEEDSTTDTPNTKSPPTTADATTAEEPK